MMTLLWGGKGGARPGFAITSPQGGRGAGKTTLAESAPVRSATMSFAANEDIKQIKERLLTPAAMTKRVALIDNVKSLRYSNADIEGLVTCDTISGRRMYFGEGSRPNTLVWICTVNGALLATDLAQRFVMIEIDPPARSGSWTEETAAFIDNNCEAIIADLVGRCARTNEIAAIQPLGVVGGAGPVRLPDPTATQELILQRQAVADVEAEEHGVVVDYFLTQLERLGYAPDCDRILVPSYIAARWWNAATQETPKSVIAVGRIIGQAIDEQRLPQLARNVCKAWPRGFGGSDRRRTRHPPWLSTWQIVSPNAMQRSVMGITTKQSFEGP